MKHVSPEQPETPLPVPPGYLMVVERDDEERYQLLRELFQNQRVEVVRDRRTRDRRAVEEPIPGANRRGSERRAPLPSTWVNVGFFVARRQYRQP